MINRILVGVSFCCVLAGAVWSQPVTESLTSGAKRLEAAMGKTISSKAIEAPLPSVPDTREVLGKQTRVCTSIPQTRKVLRAVIEIPIPKGNAGVFPGELLQGKKFAEGVLGEINIPRAGGSFKVRGIGFASDGARESFSVDEVFLESFMEELKPILAQKIKGAEAVSTFDVIPAYSIEQLAFELGADGRFVGTEFASHLGIPKELAPGMNYVVLRSQRRNFYITFNEPDSPYDFFLKGEKFKDQWNHIGSDNPPLFVKSIDYGQLAYVTIASPNSLEALKSALEAKFSNGEDKEEVIKEEMQSTEKILADAKITGYFKQGGNASGNLPKLTLQNLKTELQKMINSPVKESVPIGMSVSYVVSLLPVEMEFATAYYKRECKMVPNKLP